MLLKSTFYVTEQNPLKHVISMFWGIGGVIETCCYHVFENMEWLCFKELKYLQWHLLKT
jgi:hypothetical protein